MSDQQIISAHYEGMDVAIGCWVKARSDEWLLGLHGLQTNARLFDDLFCLPEFSSYSTLAMDCVGFGASDKPEPFSYDLQAQAIICQQIIHTLGIKKLHMVGHSMGGMIGTLLLPLLGNDVLSFINLEGNLTLADCGVSRQTLETDFEAFRHQHYVAFKQQLQHSTEPSADCRRLGLAMIPDYAFYRSAQSIVAWASSERILQLFCAAPQPKLFLYGDRNPSKIASLSGAHSLTLRAIRNAGHFLLCDNPTATHEAIRDFINEARRPGP